MGMNALEVRRRVMLAQPHEAVASGAVASFPTDVVSPLPMEFDLVPIQDLHGQSNPYPPGGSKNLFGAKLSDCKTINTNGTWSNNAYTMNGVTFTVYEYDGYIERIETSGTATATTALVVGGVELTEGVTYIFNGCPSGGSNSKYEIMAVKKPQQGSSGIDYNSHDYGNGVTYTETETTTRGLQCVIRNGQKSNGLVFYPMVRLATVADGTFAPYSNICPITGYDGFTRTGTGKNLFDGEVYMRAFVAQSATTANIQGNAYWRSIYARVEGGKTYTISRTTIETNRFRMVATVDEPTVGEDAVILSNSADNDSLYAVTVTIPDGYNYLFIYLSNQGATVTPGNYQIELGSHATTIVPYQGHSYETTFPTPPGTVYGGHVVDNGDGTGTLTVTRAIYTITGNETWTAWGNAYYSNVLSVPAVNDGNSVNCIASMLAGASTGNLYASTTGVGARNRSIYIDSNSYANLSAFVGMTIVYKLATPQTYTLPMTALQSLIGQNNIWVDNADSVSVEYWGH